MVCSVGIFYYKRAYSAGNLISGCITLQAAGVLLIETIVLTIDKESEIRVDEINNKTISNEKTSRQLGRFIIYGDRTKRILPGVHKFPFSFRMMPGEGATIEYKKITEKRHIYALNKYISKCEVKIYGIFKPVAKSVKEICLIEAAPDEILRKSYRHQINRCLCFNSSTIDILMIHDSILYAGNEYPIDISISTGAKLTEITIELQMEIKPYFSDSMNPILISFPCKVIKNKANVFVIINDTLPSETSKNDFFSISYNMVSNLWIKGKGKTKIVKRVSIRSKGLSEECKPLEIPDSLIYPEKYLSLLS